MVFYIYLSVRLFPARQTRDIEIVSILVFELQLFLLVVDVDGDLSSKLELKNSQNNVWFFNPATNLLLKV